MIIFKRYGKPVRCETYDEAAALKSSLLTDGSDKCKIRRRGSRRKVHFDVITYKGEEVPDEAAPSK